MIIRPPIRSTDAHGSGYFGAPRGSKTHRGVDIACIKGSGILSISDGKVTKIGFPYPQKKPSVYQPEKFLKKKALRYVEVQRNDNLRFRYFYIKPIVKVGDIIKKGDLLGITAGLNDIYPGITDHVHIEIKLKDGSFIDPTQIINPMEFL